MIKEKQIGENVKYVNVVTKKWKMSGTGKRKPQGSLTLNPELNKLCLQLS